MRKKILSLAVTILLIGFIGCGQNKEETEDQSAAQNQMQEITKAVAHLESTEGNKVTGTVTFTKVDSGIHITADIEGLKPGKHGFHIHEKGDCSAPDGSSAGGHFNPDNVKHGAPTDSVRHVGDMGNITADKDGKAHFEWTDNLMAFSGSHNIIGKAVIVHSAADDLKSQPSGNAGSRIACGVIEEE